MSGFSATLNGSLDPGLRSALDGAKPCVITGTDFSVDLLGQLLNLGTLQVFHPSSEIADAAEVLAELEAGTAEGRRIHVRATDGSGFRVWIVERWPDPEKKIVPEPSGIPGIPESPGLEPALSALAATQSEASGSVAQHASRSESPK
jgi:hypothetical protein